MLDRLIMFVAIAALASALLCGCGDSKPRFSEGEIETMRNELLELAERGDFYFERSFYVGAKEDYEQIVKKAANYLYYGRQDSEVEAVLKRAEERLESEEMAQAAAGKTLIGGRWVDPAVYSVEKAAELRSWSDASLPDKTAELEAALMEAMPLTDDLLEDESAKALLALGREATPFVVGWLNREERDAQYMALVLLQEMEDNEDIIFTSALAHLGSERPSVVRQSVALLKRFPCNETTVALIPFLEREDEELLGIVITVLCETKTELGRRVLLERTRNAPRLSLFRQVALGRIHLLNSVEAVEILSEAVREAADDPNQAYIRTLATRSLLETGIPEAVPVLTEVLQRAGISDRDAVMEILKRVRETSYAGAAPAVARAFITFADDKEVTELAVDVMEQIADRDSVQLLIDMVLSMDIRMIDLAGDVDTEGIFARITNLIRDLKDEKTAGRFMNMLTSYQAPETVVRAVHALGVLEVASAVPKLWDVYRSAGNNMVKMAVLNAMARIGSPAAMEKVAIVIKTEPPGEVRDYATLQVPRVIARETAFEDLFSRLEGAPDEAVRALFGAIAEDKKPLAVAPLLRTARSVETDLRYQALRALASFGEQFTEEDLETLSEIVREDIAYLQDEPDVVKVREAFSVLKLYVDTATPVFLESARAKYWPIRYYSAEALAGASPETVRRHRSEIRTLYKAIVSGEDYHSGLRLAECLGVSDEETERINRAGSERGRKILESEPSGIALGFSREALEEKLGKDYEKVGPEGSGARYLFYGSLGLVFALVEDRESGQQKVWGVGYVKGFTGSVYAAKLGENISDVLMTAGPPPEDASPGIQYTEQLHGYAFKDTVRHRYVFYKLGYDKTIRYVAEVSESAGEEMAGEFREVLENIPRAD